MTENLMFEKVRVILLNGWDPIGVVDHAEAADEYNSYIPSLLSALKNGAGPHAVADMLTTIEKTQMGIIPDRERAMAVAERIIAATGKYPPR